MSDANYYREWNSKNPEKVKEKNKKWRDKNKESTKKRISEWVENNKDKRLASVKKWQTNNPDKVRNQSLKRKYGISLDEYGEMFSVQKGLCYICNKKESKKYKNKIRLLSVDHNHITGKVRALLCDACNRGIAVFKENIEYLNNAKNYLEKFNKEGH